MNGTYESWTTRRECNKDEPGCYYISRACGGAIGCGSHKQIDDVPVKHPFTPLPVPIPKNIPNFVTGLATKEDLLPKRPFVYLNRTPIRQGNFGGKRKSKKKTYQFTGI